MINYELLRNLPSVDELLSNKYYEEIKEKYPHNLIADSIRFAITKIREEIKSGNRNDFSDEDIFKLSDKYINSKNMSSLKKVINGTGIVLHTNLGRAPINNESIIQMASIAGDYNNLEYDIETGKRGSRYEHTTEIIKEITGAEDVLIVNNNAAAVFLILNTLSQNKETIVSRGELVEIGGSFRISSIMEKSGAQMIEIGSTNRTHLKDYDAAISNDTALIFKVHTSNFKVKGFHSEVTVSELKNHFKDEYPIAEDLGSGTIFDLSEFGLSKERTVMDALKEGVDIVCFSGDKILGSVQAGIIVGKKDIIEKIKENQLLRAFRVDKLVLSALEKSMMSYRDKNFALKNIPVLKMISMPLSQLEIKAENLKNIILEKNPQMKIKIKDFEAPVGGGSYPLDSLKSKALYFKLDNVNRFEGFLRQSEIPIIGIIKDDFYILDLRTIFEKDFETIANTITKYFKVIK
ncbi:MAG: L-seryl-tRNA(Sec) selenium transferase [Tissierellia bacterium]|nr:L-seryl-tRNA(Sec) selenium transferase [Tissierellia bacterium]